MKRCKKDTEQQWPTLRRSLPLVISFRTSVKLFQ
ncbi:unnamed protein product [Chondrus crispus]|uniref:Uncharacterized protein n=1 Tax=Chondrus crispus TaxID=2769 RepID=R7QLT3_CHOCR|nr:unnamed protein product [Chondrus crispus]CDF39039.1 unnamed protein product [Chondrus crispus]|eukprot:XP_005718944.1 unnamed protein product [Chondrus crispus]